MKSILKALFLLVALTTALPAFAQPEFDATKARAEAGDAEAQFDIGWMYYIGESVAQNVQEAIKWLRLAAEQGNADAQTNLGLMYVNGTFVDSNHQEAIKLFRLAAEQGNAEAQAHLLSMYKVDTRTYIRAMYDNGISVEQKEQELFKFNWFKEGSSWYRLKAVQGYDFAQYALADMYVTGTGVDRNYQEAVRWYRLAAKQGKAEAQIGLGFEYEIGRGVPLNNVRAYVWFSVAAAQGDEHGRILRDALSERLTPEELARAQDLATRCFESNFTDCD
jgi:TPR repeat protein